MSKINYAILIVSVFTSLFLFSSFQTKNPNTIYQFKMKNIDGKEISLSDFKGKVVVIVNVASECGYTPQYARLQTFYALYKEKGVEVLGFPANNFLGQEPGTDAEIKTFCTSKYNVTFPMFSKISVKGNDMHPLYHFLTEKNLNGVMDAEVKWNFNKFIINKKGEVVTHLLSKVKPDDEEFLNIINEELKK